MKVSENHPVLKQFNNNLSSISLLKQGMAKKTKNSTAYENFDPSFDLVKEEALDTLIINLPEFKKEQLRVKVSRGVLKISGDRPTNSDGTKRSRFLKEIRTPDGCNINDIQAKLTNGRLHITMPKKITLVAPKVTQKQPGLTSGPQSELNDKMPKARSLVFNDRKTKDTSTSYDQPTRYLMFAHGNATQRLLGRKMVFLGLGIASVTMVAIGAFVAYKILSQD